MPRGNPIPKEIKEEILRRLKDGEGAIKLSAEYGIKDKTIYKWVSNTTRKINPIFEVSRLKREIKGLYEMIGFLTVERSRQKKEF